MSALVLAQEFPTLEPAQMVLRVAAAAALGGVVGLERELRDQPAGFRTHILVSIGSALFTLLGVYGLAPFTGAAGPVALDPTRVAAQVVTGIGFLGAGAIIRYGATVRGLTTAAALWVTAAIGTAAAFGFWAGAVTTTIITVGSLYGLKALERKVVHRLRPGFHEFAIATDPELRLSQLAHAIEAFGGRLESGRMETDERGRHHFVILLRTLPRFSPEEIVEKLQDVHGVLEVEWTG